MIPPPPIIPFTSFTKTEGYIEECIKHAEILEKEEQYFKEKTKWKCINRLCYNTAIRRGQRCSFHQERDGCCHCMQDGHYRDDVNNKIGFWLIIPRGKVGEDQ